MVDMGFRMLALSGLRPDRLGDKFLKDFTREQIIAEGRRSFHIDSHINPLAENRKSWLEYV